MQKEKKQKIDKKEDKKSWCNDKGEEWRRSYKLTKRLGQEMHEEKQRKHSKRKWKWKKQPKGKMKRMKAIGGGEKTEGREG